ncbi:hypothetical protein [Paraburkholderia tagetis]|uniref:Uncharacterized protein n=1 Tax=Paraburkholderia tagetis TaxID=2913261 RepID=A0A9X1UJ26_9BURK|nr:hypothetical protein [Paraburkholderia tagetis]MCG5076343.1 hypothetical protein [Paraburkholderia tagetis]
MRASLAPALQISKWAAILSSSGYCWASSENDHCRPVVPGGISAIRLRQDFQDGLNADTGDDTHRAVACRRLDSVHREN